MNAIIDTEVVPYPIVYSDALSSYNVLDVSAFRRLSINHSKLFVGQKTHVNVIENL